MTTRPTCRSKAPHVLYPAPSSIHTHARARAHAHARGCALALCATDATRVPCLVFFGAFFAPDPQHCCCLLLDAHISWLPHHHAKLAGATATALTAVRRVLMVLLRHCCYLLPALSDSTGTEHLSEKCISAPQARKAVVFDFDKCLMKDHWWAKYRTQ